MTTETAPTVLTGPEKEALLAERDRIIRRVVRFASQAGPSYAGSAAIYLWRMLGSEVINMGRWADPYGGRPLRAYEILHSATDTEAFAATWYGGHDGLMAAMYEDSRNGTACCAGHRRMAQEWNDRQAVPVPVPAPPPSAPSIVDEDDEDSCEHEWNTPTCVHCEGTHEDYCEHDHECRECYTSYAVACRHCGLDLDDNCNHSYTRECDDCGETEDYDG